MMWRLPNKNLSFYYLFNQCQEIILKKGKNYFLLNANGD